MLTTLSYVPPFLPLLVASVACLATRRAGTALTVVAGSISLVLVWTVAQEPAGAVAFLGYTVYTIGAGTTQRVVGTLLVAAALAVALQTWRAPSRTLPAAAQVHGAAALIVCFAGDLVSTYVGLELVALSGIALIWCSVRAGTAPGSAFNVGMRYALLLLTASFVVKLGIEGAKGATGSATLSPLALDAPHAWLILAGLVLYAVAAPLALSVRGAQGSLPPAAALALHAFTSSAALLPLVLLMPTSVAALAVAGVLGVHGLAYSVRTIDLLRVLAVLQVIERCGALLDALGERRARIEAGMHQVSRRWLSAVDQYGAGQGFLPRAWRGAGTTVLWFAALLAGYVVFQYF
jgi:hypothetical protein